jgi:hypothetical protein
MAPSVRGFVALITGLAARTSSLAPTFAAITGLVGSGLKARA